MSSKKATSKAPAKASASEKKSAPAKKPAAKAAPAPAKKAPAKAAPAKASAKSAPAKKPAAKAAPAPAKKAPAKAAPAKAAPAKKPVAKKEVPAKKEPVKAVKAAPAPVAKKPAPAKKVEPAVVAKAPAAPKKAVEKEVVKETVKETEKKVVKEPVKEVEAVAEKVSEKAPEKAKVDVPEKVEVKKSSVKSDYPYAVLLEGGKKPCKFIMFVEIDEQEERANKKKVTSEMKNLEKKPTSAIRHKISLAEETQEELTERILKELEEQNAAFTREAATQICTRCNKNLVSPEFWVDKHLGYCEECAAILHLGQSKEARKVEYQLGAMGGDSLDEADDDEFEGPDAADLKEAEEELADFDD